jgi:predicted Zn-dependent protease
MLEFMAWSMDAKEADEGTSAFMGKLGAGVAGTGITVSSQPDHPACPGAPFADDGMPSSTVDWVRDGLVANLATSRYWAQHTGRAYTGFPSNLLMQGGAGGLDDLVAGTSDGILVTRFWYIRFVDPMKLLLTGMTRDGLFRIRDGEIVGGLRNLRFNDSPLRMLANTVEIGTPVPAGTYLPALIPALKVDGFTFTSGTAF